MIFRKHSPRWALWVFAAALLLKSAMPFLATASAQLQGKTLVEVCTVYGVTMVPLAGEPASNPADHAPGHGGEHCALTALAGFAPVEAAAVAWVPPASGPLALRLARTPAAVPDPSADWAARLEHGPPALS